MNDATFGIGDILAAFDGWDNQRQEFLDNLRRAKQPEPTPETMTNFRDVFVESFLKGRTSK